MDALRQRPQLVERDADVGAHLLEEAKRLARVGLDEPARRLQLDRERDELLLHAVVQRALDRAAFVVVGEQKRAQIHTDRSPLSGRRSQGG